MTEEIFLRLGFVWLKKNDIGQFVKLYIKGKIPAQEEELNNFVMDYEVYEYLVDLGQKLTILTLEEEEGNDGI
jgi:hypothetical protein